MISIHDCIAMCGLNRDEVDAIAEHEHVPEIEAAALASELMHRAGGAAEVRDMLVDDIRAAAARNDRKHAAELLATLRHFLRDHPEATRPIPH